MRRGPAIVLVAAALLLAGCSSGTDDTASGSAETPVADASAAPTAAGAPGGSADFQAYQQCLSDNGVDVSSFGQRGAGGQRPSGMPTDQPSGMPTDMPSGMPTDMPSGAPQGGGMPGGGMQAPDGVDATTWAAAQKACASLQPTGGPGMRGNTGTGQGAVGTAASYKVFWSCMTDHDVTAPDSGLPKDLDTSKAAVAAALKICQKLLPEGTSLGS